MYKRIAVVSVVALVLIGALIGLYIWERNHSTYGGKVPDTPEDAGFILNGREYELRGDVDTILILGLDTFESSVDHSSYNNNSQADFLMLLVLDHSTKTCRAIQLNRDTMADVTVLGLGGKVVGTVHEQLALAHTYGSGAGDSCRNTVSAVSKLLYGISIDHYFSLTMDAVSILNDMVGGVSVKLLDDFTAYDPALQQGATVNLKGEQALYYVRGRYGIGDSSNINRMARQQQYLKALYHQVISFTEQDDTFSSDVVLELNEYMISDCSVTEMDRLFDLISSYSIGEFYSLEGTLSKGEKYMEFEIDKEATKELVADLFYRLKPENDGN